MCLHVRAALSAPRSANSTEDGEQSGEPERRIGRVLKSKSLGRRRVTLVVSRKDPMASIDRTRFAPDSQIPGLRGSFTISGRKYEGFLNTWSGDMERTWTNAERIAEFLETRFVEIETLGGTGWAYSPYLWAEGRGGFSVRRLELPSASCGTATQVECVHSTWTTLPRSSATNRQSG
jgi:hypothetical protein